MSSYEMKDNSGSLFKNNRREKDTHPNATGKVMIDGKLYYINAWTKKDKDGNPWQSLAFKRVESREDDAGARAEDTGRRGSLKDQLDDDIPF